MHPPQLGWWSKLPIGMKLLAIGLISFTLISLTLFAFQVWISIQTNICWSSCYQHIQYTH